MRKEIKPGTTLLDADSNIELYTVMFEELAWEKSRLYAFEPNDSNFAHLQFLTKGLSNIVVDHCAVGASSGMLTLY